MSNHIIDDSMAQILNQLPGRVSNQLLLGAIIETRTQLIEKVDQLSVQVEDLDNRLRQVEEEEREQAENPSLIWLARNRPGVVLKAILVILSLVGVAQAPEVLGLLINLFGG